MCECIGSGMPLPSRNSASYSTNAAARRFRRSRLGEAGNFRPIRRNRQIMAVNEFTRLLVRFQPAELVLETPAERPRLAKALALALIAEAADRGLTVEGYQRSDVQGAFTGVGST